MKFVLLIAILTLAGCDEKKFDRLAKPWSASWQSGTNFLWITNGATNFHVVNINYGGGGLQ